MRYKISLMAAAAAAPLLMAAPAQADSKPAFGAPIALGDGFSLDPIVEGRLRLEDVQQPQKALAADAVTMRLRAGFELKNAPSHLALLAEAEGNLALDGAYNAFPYTLKTSSQYRPTHAVVADPDSVGLNRLQLQFKTKPLTLTLGRQRINLDDQRWVGASGWRQNEQTFDAVRGQVALGPVSFDGSFAESQRSIYGTDGGPRVAYDGRFAFLNAGIGNQIATLKGFAYLLDYNNSAFQNLKATRGQLDSSQTYGLRTTAKLPIEKGVSLALAGSYARQYSYAANPRHYAADYYAVEGNLAACGFTLTGGYEMMGADAHAVGGPWSVQTPMATLHAFDGWADVFLTTPARGLGDTYAGLAYAFPKAVPVPGLNAKVIYHQFDSDIGNVNYGHEWDAAIGFKTGFLNWLVKYADYRAVGASALGAGTTTRKFWLQSEFAF